LKGKSVEEAAKLDNMDLVEELNLPPVKIHCSVLAQDAVQSAINDYRTKNGLEPLVFEEKLH
jgi:nitrogen fixation NifU-like protein